jgi:hypothetical protein
VSTQGQGPLNDPRLVERRGDLSGLNALMFLILVVVGFLAAALFLYTLITGSPVPSASPSPTALVTPGASSSASTGPSASSSPSAFPAASASLPITVRVGTPAPVIVDGQFAGQATVVSAKVSRSLQGKISPRGSRWLLVSVLLEATANLPFDENLWTAIDTSGVSYGWRGSDPPPSLGRGTLSLGQTRTGNVTFQVPAKRRIARLVLEADDGSQLVVVSLP